MALFALVLVACSGSGEQAPDAPAAPAAIFAAIAAGSQHTCALTRDGHVMCWGVNRDSQLGVERNADLEAKAYRVDGVEDVKAIAAGGDVSCALTNAGAVFCWGEGRKLGTGSSAESHVPLPVVGLSSGVSAISVGGGHACALMDDGNVKCWGLNLAFELGDGTREERLAPVDVVGLEGPAKTVFAMGSSTCAELEVGGVYCWGDRIYSVRGSTGNRIENQHSDPQLIPQFSKNVTDLTGSGSVCYLDETRTMQCFGYNPTGILGNGSTDDTATPVAVTALGVGVLDMDLGSGHACAVTAAGGVWCWGELEYFENYGGAIPGTVMENADYGPNPIAMPGLESGIVAVATGTEHICVLREAGNILCWGHNPFGQLGNGTTKASSTPVDLQLAAPQP